MTRTAGIFAAALLWATGAAAQEPLSAIDWLSDSVAAPPTVAAPGGGAPVSDGAMPGDVSVAPLGRATPDAVGLLPPSVTGLPPDLWGTSLSGDIARRLRSEHADMPPALRRLLYTILLAELDPPVDAGPEPRLFLARVDALLELGALDQAWELLQRAGARHPEIFRRIFDTALLLRVEDEACTILRATPQLSPTFPARIFCLARGGDWEAAALTLGIARALGYIDPEDDALLSRFLDPVLFEGDMWVPPPENPTPLEFRMLEAIGEPLPTAGLPRAYAHADLQSNSGWKTQIEAAERLTRTGALDPNRLLGLYTERKPAASGGLWERVHAVQALDAAIRAGDPGAVVEALPEAWAQMSRAGLEPAFAALYAEPLSALRLPPRLAGLVFTIGLLSDGYEQFARDFPAESETEQLLMALARGAPGDFRAADPLHAAIQEGFRRDSIPVRLQSLMAENRLGEAILRAMELFVSGARGDLDELTDALAFLRAVGLEETARRAAIELIILGQGEAGQGG